MHLAQKVTIGTTIIDLTMILLLKGAGKMHLMCKSGKICHQNRIMRKIYRGTNNLNLNRVIHITPHSTLVHFTS